MKYAPKIAIGAGLAGLLGWFAHGPAGNGAAFVQDLRERASIALAARDVTDVSVDFQTQPLSRVAILNGSLTAVNKSNAAGIVGSVPGVSFARWAGHATPPGLPPAASPAAEPAHATTALPKPISLSSNATRTPDATPKPPLASTAATSDCQSGIDKAVNGRVLSFRPGSAWLNPQSHRIIGDIAAVLKHCPGAAIEVGGYTDGSGSKAARAMSEERAKRVRDELIAQGAAANAVTARGHGAGSSGPASRRIAFTVVKGGR